MLCLSRSSLGAGVKDGESLQEGWWEGGFIVLQYVILSLIIMYNFIKHPENIRVKCAFKQSDDK